jgi:hypothetical protein
MQSHALRSGVSTRTDRKEITKPDSRKQKNGQYWRFHGAGDLKKPFGNSETKRRTHEAKINMSFVNLLYTICLLLPTELKRESIQHHLNLHIGEAEYKAIVDGGLVDPDGEMQVLLEVKAFAQNGLVSTAQQETASPSSKRRWLSGLSKTMLPTGTSRQDGPRKSSCRMGLHIP